MSITKTETLTVENIYDDTAPVLCCANCGFEFLHQEEVHIFENREGSDLKLHTMTNKNVTAIDSDLSDNPSSRRQAVSIFFSCEGCDRITRLDIVQHKGNTYLNTSVLLSNRIER